MPKASWHASWYLHSSQAFGTQFRWAACSSEAPARASSNQELGRGAEALGLSPTKSLHVLRCDAAGRCHRKVEAVDRSENSPRVLNVSARVSKYPVVTAMATRIERDTRSPSRTGASVIASSSSR